MVSIVFARGDVSQVCPFQEKQLPTQKAQLNTAADGRNLKKIYIYQFNLVVRRKTALYSCSVLGKQLIGGIPRCLFVASQNTSKHRGFLRDKCGAEKHWLLFFLLKLAA